MRVRVRVRVLIWVCVHLISYYVNVECKNGVVKTLFFITERYMLHNKMLLRNSSFFITLSGSTEPQI